MTGSQLVEIEHFQDRQPGKIGEFKGYPTIPTTITGLSDIEKKISGLLDRATNVPIEEISGSINLAAMELNRGMKALRIVLENENLKTIPNEAQATLEAVRAIVEARETNAIPGEAEAALVALRSLLEDERTRELPQEAINVLTAARFQLQGESSEVYQLNRTLKEVESAARALREFLDFLEQNPESLIRGKSDRNQ